MWLTRGTQNRCLKTSGRKSDSPGMENEYIFPLDDKHSGIFSDMRLVTKQCLITHVYKNKHANKYNKIHIRSHLLYKVTPLASRIDMD